MGIKSIRAIELFGGIGSQTKALNNLKLDFEHYRLVEFDKYAIKSYNAVHSTNFSAMDITKISSEDLGITNTKAYNYLLTYSFPCQDLSRAGKKKGMTEGSGTRSSLLWEVKRLFSELTEYPQVLLMENVSQVHGKVNLENFNNWISFLKELGYSNFYTDLSATGFEVPQTRKRCFMVSLLKTDKFDFPEEQKLTKTAFDFLQSEVELNYFLSDRMTRYILDLNESQAGTKWEGITNNDLLNPEIVHTLSVRGAGGQQRAGVSNFFIPGDYPRNWKVSEIKNFIKENNYIPAIRKLTPRECWRLMGFSDIDFEAAARVNSDAQLYKQAGNSIVVPVLEAIFERIYC